MLFESGKVRTKLVWSGKRENLGVLPKLPFQLVEVINETKKKTLESYISVRDGWYNLLIWGDNKLVMNSLLDTFEGKINLIYIDPPFATGADFRMSIKIEGEEIIKEPSGIEIKVYRDTWGKGLASYLQMMYDRLILMKKLLAENGTIYVHTDWHIGHYIKIILDEIFGKENFMNEIIWHYRTGNIATKFFRRAHDVILVYKKGENPTFNPIEVKEYYWQIYGPRFKPSFKGRKHGKDELGEYRISFVDDVWDISAVFTLGSEHLPFPTQKPEKLLERIIKASSNEGDLIADFFCGSGTTLAVAEKLGRRWIGCDLSKYAIHITRKRLLDIPGCRPFKVLNLGMYQKHKLMENGIENYIDFILKIYGATRISGYSYLHGRKGRRLIHVATPDSFVTEREVRRALEECRSANSTGLDVLGWEFEMGLHELIDEIARDYGVDIRLKLIPTDILDIRQKDVTDIKFFDLNL